MKNTAVCTAAMKTLLAEKKKSRRRRRYLLNLVDTPGHADFAHEVARSLAACEGAVVLVDATQGVQAQTIATVRAARSRRLALVPAANKIDAPNADAEATSEQMRAAFGADQMREVVPVSAKTGEGVEALLRAIVDRIPSPVEARRRAESGDGEGEGEGEEGEAGEAGEEGEGEEETVARAGEACSEGAHSSAAFSSSSSRANVAAGASSFASRPFRALLLDSRYDAYRGAVLTVRVFDGEVRVGDRVAFLAPHHSERLAESDLLEGVSSIPSSADANDDAKRKPGPGPGSGSFASPPRDASEVLELGMMTPEPTKVPFLRAGHVGYVITAAAKGGGGGGPGKKRADKKKKGAGVKGGGAFAFASPGGRVGDTLVRPDEYSRSRSGAASAPPPPPPPSPLPGFRTARPMVFQGLFPASADQHELMRATIRRVAMNDASVAFEEETSAALGPGFRCGFLGLLHADVFRQRLAEEAARGGGHLEVIATAPAVPYQVVLNDADASDAAGGGKKSKSRGGVRVLSVSSPADFDAAAAVGPRGGRAVVREPLVDATIVAPADRVGGIVELCASRRGARLEHRHLDASRVAMTYRLPLGEVAADFADALKSRTAGFATVDFSDRIRYAPADIVRVDVSVNGQSVDALSFLTHASNAARRGRARVERLAAELPRQLYEVAVRATVQPGNKVVASEKIGAVRKNVLAKCYGGDVSRKKKLLAKQKEGKKRMKKIGNVDVPHGVFQSVIDA